MTISAKHLSSDLAGMQENLEILFQESAVKQQLVLGSHEDAEKTISTKQHDLLQGLGFSSTGNIQQFQENKKVLEKAGLTLGTIKQLKEIKDKYNKYIISYSNMAVLCAKHNLYFGDATLFTGEMPMKNVKELELFPFSEFGSNYSVVYARNGESIVEGNVSSSCKAMIVAPLNLFKLNNVFIADSRELIQFSGIKSKCIYPVAEDPIVVLPFKASSTREIFFLIITHWDSSKSII